MAEVRVRGWAIPYIHPTGEFIRNYLLKQKVAHGYEIWNALRLARLEAGLVDAEGRTRVSTYHNFMVNYIYVLKKLGLIELVKKGPSTRAGMSLPRHYYRIVPGRENDHRWAHPQIAYDPRRGAPRYRRPYAKIRKKKLIPRPLPPEELDRIWDAASTFLREYRYVLTREQFETIKPEWPSEAQLYPTFEERVGSVIGKVVETEYVSRIARRLIRPEEAPEPFASEARKVGRTLEREWLRRHGR